MTRLVRVLRPQLRRLDPRVERGLHRSARVLKALGSRMKRQGDRQLDAAAGPTGPATVDPTSAAGAQGFRRVPRECRTVILMYHRIAVDPDDPYWLSVAPDRFADQMDRLRRLADPIPLAEVTRRSHGRRVAVTFDDGFADNVNVALPILEEVQVPATVFVVSDLVGSGETNWQYRLESMFRNERPGDGKPGDAKVDLTIGAARLTLDLGSQEDRTRSLLAVHKRLRHLPLAEIEEVADELKRLLGENRSSGRQMMTIEELRRLANSDLVTIGAHTRRHPWLASLVPEEQSEEIAGSRRLLAGIVDGPVDQFAYPYGSADSFNRSSVRSVRRAGFSLACTAYGDPIVPGTSRFRLPRRAVLDWEGEEFERRVTAWLRA